jgi:serine/threonine protein kinase
MAPEQVRGQTVDCRADIFSFGAVLYKMLSGQRAFHKDSPVETLNAKGGQPLRQRKIKAEFRTLLAAAGIRSFVRTIFPTPPLHWPWRPACPLRRFQTSSSREHFFHAERDSHVLRAFRTRLRPKSSAC